MAHWSVWANSQHLILTASSHPWMSWVCKRVWMCACLRHHPRWTLTGQEEALKWCGLSGGLIQPEWNIRLCTPTQQTKATADHLKLDSSDTRKQHEVEHWPCSIWIVSKVKHQQNKIYYKKKLVSLFTNTIHAYNDLNKPLLVFNFYIKSKLISCSKSKIGDSTVLKLQYRKKQVVY